MNLQWQEILDSFANAEFWYVDQGIVASGADGSNSFCKAIQRQEEKWWLPLPRVPAGGLSEDSRKQLNYKRECTNQILKAAMAINNIALAEMDVPDSYLESLPKVWLLNLFSPLDCTKFTMLLHHCKARYNI